MNMMLGGILENQIICPDTGDHYSFIFPVFELTESPLRQYELIQQFVSLVNTRMKSIAGKLGIEKKVTSYVARHTFSTVLKRSGSSIEFIQEALDHSDTKTTQNYLDSIELGVKKEHAMKLLKFKE